VTAVEPSVKLVASSTDGLPRRRELLGDGDAVAVGFARRLVAGFGFAAGVLEEVLSAVRRGRSRCAVLASAFSFAVRMIVSLRPRSIGSAASRVAASASGTRRAAKRSTVAGSGIERPVAARSGTGSRTPSRTRVRSQRVTGEPSDRISPQS
jgi:hypothetical protein